MQPSLSNLLCKKLSLPFDRHLPEKWRNPPAWLNGYMLLLLLAGLIFQLYVPIEFHDSDMWYHLHGGERFWASGEIPDNSYFSFIQPERTFVNYYWGFQALIAKLYQFSGYSGLLILRALLFFLTTVLAYRFIIEEKDSRSHIILVTLLFIAYFTLIEGRTINLRPHLFSQMFMLLFLYILERRPGWAPLLPLITLIWVNLHGIEWVIPGLIGGAYLIEYLIGRYRHGLHREHNWLYPASIIACAPAVLLTPHGFDLLGTPFDVPPFVSMFINEMQPLDTRLFYTIVFNGNKLSYTTIFSILFLISCYLFLRALIRNKLRISHAILALAGIALLLKGIRFQWEWAFLTLPLLSHAIATEPAVKIRTRGMSLFGLALLIVLSLPFINIIKQWQSFAPYPLNTWTLPTGSIKFLRQQAPQGGNIMVPLSRSGYFHYALQPNFRVYADLQMSLFTDFDIFTVFRFNTEKHSTNQLLEQYPLDYLLITNSLKKFPSDLEDHPEFKPVFLDDFVVIYANEKRHPKLVKEFELKATHPFTPAGVKDDDDPDKILAELKRMLSFDPNSDRINHAITRILSNEERYADVITWGERFLIAHPDNPNSYYLLGDALHNQDNCEKAIPLFKRGLDVSDETFKKVLYTHIGSCYNDLQDFDQAYAYLKKGINPYTNLSNPEFLYQLAYSAYIIGKVRESTELLDMLAFSLPDDRKKLREKTLSFTKKLQQAEKELPSFFSWAWKMVSGNVTPPEQKPSR